MARKAYRDFGSALLAYRNRPEGEPEPIKTNWTTVPANDNADPEETADYSFERNLRVTPSVEEIMRQVECGDEIRNYVGQIVRIGNLRFSDGTHREKAHCYGADNKIINGEFIMPTGAMLGCREKAETQSGGKGYTQSQLERSNDFFAETLGTIAPRYVKRTKRRNGKSLTAEQSRIELEKAIANTPIMPPVTRYKAGLPCGTQRIADCFVGMQKGKKCESGAIMWQDIASAKVHREIWEETIARLSEEDTMTLNTSMEAKTLRQIGEAHGFSGKRAERMGKKILRAANDNLSETLKELAS